MNNYRWITLTSRNIDCSKITVDEFISMMNSDLLEAQEKYNDLYIPEWEARKIKNFEDRIIWVRKNAIKFAEKKWKTEKRRNIYVESEVDKARKKYTMDAFYYDLSFFDFKVNPGDMGISDNCILSYKGLTSEKLHRCFEKIKDNKYFKKAKGWKLTYECSENSYCVSFRPQIKLIVDSETEAQMKHDEEVLTNAVNEFYKGCQYWGD